MLKKVLATLGALVAVAGASFVIMHTLRAQGFTASDAHAASLPGGYSQLQKGMTQKQVSTLLGKPTLQGLNRHFEQKTPAQWASIQSQVDADASQTNTLDSAVSIKDIQLNGELEHRIKYIWQFKPTSTIDAVLRFDENGNLTRWDFMPTLKGPAHGGATGPSSK